MRDRVNRWIGDLFAREYVDRTVKALAKSQARPAQSGVDREQARKRLARFTAAIKAGIAPAALVEATNEAQRDRAAAQAALKNAADSANLSCC